MRLRVQCPLNLSCCGNIDRRRRRRTVIFDNGRQTIMHLVFNPTPPPPPPTSKKKSVNDMLQSIFPLQKSTACCLLDLLLFAIVINAFILSDWKSLIHESFVNLVVILYSIASQMLQHLCTELPALVGLSVASDWFVFHQVLASSRPRVPVFKAILTRDLRERHCNQPLRASVRTSFH